MILKELLKNIKVKQLVGDDTTEVADIQQDSRAVAPGHLFVAVRGTQTDGHVYIDKAIAQGASVIVCETLPEQLSHHITYVQVADTEQTVGKLCTTLHGDPTANFELVGVTGTNGKTTVATLLFKLFRRMGYRCGLISTVANYIDEEMLPTERTTPDPVTLNKLLARMSDAGCKYVFMEVSSHAVAQHRIAGLRFAGAIFTNLTRDHLDYHKTFDNYLRAKKKFFDDLPPTAFALTNIDDKNGKVMVQNTRAQVHTYSLRTGCDFKGKLIEESFEGMMLEINGIEVNVPFIGRFNAYNLLALAGATVLLGKDLHTALVHISALHPVSGRFEALRAPQGYTAIVDYAHTPDAIENVLSAIHDILHGEGEVITVIGAGGNRDKGKRPLMAKEALKQSDKVIITSDNPRFEDPEDIIHDMMEGIDKAGMKKVITLTDRKEAIKTACMLAKAGDVILIAGKGHETYQEIKGVKYHFDDKEVVRAIFE